MRKYGVYLIAAFFIAGCSTAAESYDSFSYRDSGFNQTNVTLSEKGLSAEQINSILGTKFPPEGKVSIAVIFLYSYNSYSNNGSGLPYHIMSKGKNINNVEKFVPVPKIFIPQKLTFDIIQDLGVRSLCEYTILFYNNSNKSMTFKQFLRGEFEFESDIEFSIIDNQTTAVIASDRLYSSIVKKGLSLSSKDIEEAENEIYTLQANLLAEKLNGLFDTRLTQNGEKEQEPLF